MKFKSAQEKGVFKTKIIINDYIDGFEQGMEDEFLVLREPNINEAQRLLKSNKDGETDMTEIQSILTGCIVGHSFLDDDNKPVSNKEVGEWLKGSSSLFYFILKEWQEQLPLVRRNKLN